jgi:hypothetical protein
MNNLNHKNMKESKKHSEYAIPVDVILAVIMFIDIVFLVVAAIIQSL